FKSQSIDTPGVIERVSTLFRGHPSLIQGFNTFLPPGYRIECSLDPSESNLITVTTPTGTTTQTPGGVGIAGAINRMSSTGSVPSVGGGGGSVGMSTGPAGPASVPASSQQAGPRAASGMGPLHGPAGGRHADQHLHHQHDGPVGNIGYGAGPGGHALGHAPAAGAYPNAGGPGVGPGQQHIHAGHAGPHGLGHPANLPPGPMGGMPHAAPHHSHGRPQSPMGMASLGPGAPSTPGATAGAGVLSHGVMPSPHGPPSALHPHDPKRPPVEFNHAINYVNKIKQRFSGDPDTYKQFLEILQTYQKEQRPIHDVYAQVTVLFEHAKDLLDEFKQFLPDTSNGAAPTSGLFNMLGQVTSGLGNQSPAVGQPAAQLPPPSQAPPPRGAPPDAPQAVDMAPGLSGKKAAVTTAAAAAAAASGTGSRKKRGAGAAEGTKGSATKSKKSKHSHKAEQRTPPLRAEPLPGSPSFPHASHPAQLHQAYGPDSIAVAEAAGMAPPGAVANGIAMGQPQVALATLDEVAFFDRVKKHIDDRPTYLEFLKLLNLYTQDIIDVRTMVDRAALFLAGHRELFATFKGLCGYEMGKHGWLDNEDPIVENVPASMRERVDLSTCKVYGASYRKLPKSEVNLACSGRDPMCWEVLNDTWVSHPTWASEGESFNPHKKNAYEDALYRSEEERHEYDYHIEANLRTIALLEPIAARITTMDPEERAAFRLKPGLGGQSKSIYQRVIKKVYGREHGLEVIAALHDNPCVAVPVVLARLKQKDEEWKRAQREWNKVWREVDARNYYKSLDHQGVNFKAADKKAITAKAFVAEIEARRTQQQQRRLAADPSLPRPKPRHQLVYVIDDMQVLTDVLKLGFSFLDRATGSYSAADRERIEIFLRSFVPKLLELDAAEFEELLNGDVETEGEDGDDRSEGTAADEDVDASSTTSAATGNGKKGKKQNGDLRKKILKSQAETSVATNGPAKAGGDSSEESAVTDASAAAALSNRASSPAIVADADTAAEALANQSSNAVVAQTTDVEMTDAEPLAPVQADQTDGSSPVKEPVDEKNRKSPEKTPEAEVDSSEGERTWIHTDLSAAYDSRKGNPGAGLGDADVTKEGRESADGDRSHRQVNFFCNTTFFLFVRLLQLLYSRLHKMKVLAAEMAAKQPRNRINPLAIELGLQDGSTGPAAVVGATANSSAAGPIAPNNEEAGLMLPPTRFYDTLLDLCEKLFDGDIDQATFEESIRYMYGIDGYIVFTLDKVIGALIKTVQALTTDSKCQELQTLMEKDRSRPQSDVSNYRQQIANRMAAESVIGKDENMFRVEWVSSTSTLLIQMLSRDDLTLDDARTAEQRWLYYISSYCLWTPTEGLPAEAGAPFLKRTLPPNAALENDPPGTSYVTRSGLEIRVCIRTYRLFFVHDTEDVFIRLRDPTEVEEYEKKAEEANKRRKSKWSKWLESRRAAIDGPDEMETNGAEADAGKEGDNHAKQTIAAVADGEPQGEKGKKRTT
ncbi:hypothetical protein IE53DRAFT_383137, partial [Violaceomyces palustris]